MPGYIIIKMILNDESLQLVKSVPQVKDFLGSPSPVSEKEVDNILNQIKIHQQNSANSDSYEVGEKVKIIEGPFDTFSATVDDVEVGKSKLRVSVSIFGRLTPIDLNFSQVRKIVKM